MDGANDTNCCSGEAVLYPSSSSSSKNGFFGKDGYVLTSGFKLGLEKNGFSFLIFPSTSTLMKGSNGSDGFSISISSCLLNSFEVDGIFLLPLLAF